jgi:hypothetical protein
LIVVRFALVGALQEGRLSTEDSEGRSLYGHKELKPVKIEIIINYLLQNRLFFPIRKVPFRPFSNSLVSAPTGKWRMGRGLE